MKKSTKLLSVLLAILMIFSSMSVMSYAAKANYKTVAELEGLDAYSPYGSVTRLSTEERMSIVFDYLDNILADANINMGQVFSFAGLSLTVDLRSVNALCGTVDSAKNLLDNWLVGILKGSLGIVKDVDISTWQKGMTRESVDQLKIVYELVEFINANKGVFKTVISSGKLDVGLIGSFVDLSGVSAYISDIPGLIKGLVYPLFERQDDDQTRINALLDKSSSMDSMLTDYVKRLFKNEMSYTTYKEDASGKCISNHVLPTTSATRNYFVKGTGGLGDYIEVHYYDKTTKAYVAEQELYFKTEEKDSTGAGTGEFVYTNADGSSIKYYETGSYLLPSFTASGNVDTIMDISTNSAATMLYNMIPYVFSEMAPVVLNGSVKKLLAEWMGSTSTQIFAGVQGADANVVANALPADAKAFFTKAAGEYMWEWSDYMTSTDGNGYYRFVEKNGVNEQWFKVDTSTANSILTLFNLDWNISSDYLNEFIPNNGTSAKGYSTILLGANDLLGKVISTMLSSKAQTAINWTAGDNSNLVPNLRKAIQYVCSFNPEYLFGSGYQANYAGYYDALVNPASTNQEVVTALGCIAIKALMPQAMLPSATSLKGQSIGAVLACVIRELATQFVPNNNYDALIFSDYNAKTLVSGTGIDNSYWLDVILTMGVDIGLEYLPALADMGEDDTTNGIGRFLGAKTYTLSDFKANPQKWENAIDWVIDWALSSDYEWCWRIGKLIDTSAFTVSLSTDEDPWVKLDSILTSLLPVNQIFNCIPESGKTFTESVLRDNFILAVLNLDFGRIVGDVDTTGILNIPSNSVLRTKSVLPAVVEVVRNLLNGLLYKVGGNVNLLDPATYTSIDSILNQQNLANLVEVLLGMLYNAINTNGLLDTALPIVNFFVGWKTDAQVMADPKLSVANLKDYDYMYTADSSTVSSTLNVRNDCSGMLLKHRNSSNADGNYNIIIDSVTVDDGSYSTTASFPLTVAPGTSAAIPMSFTYTADKSVMITVNYRYTFKDGTNLGGTQTAVIYQYISNVESDTVPTTIADGDADKDYTGIDPYHPYVFTTDVFSTISNYAVTIRHTAGSLALANKKTFQSISADVAPTGLGAQYFNVITDRATAGFATTISKNEVVSGKLYQAKSGVDAATAFPYGNYDMGTAAVKYGSDSKVWTIDFIYYTDYGVADVAKEYESKNINISNIDSNDAASVTALNEYITALKNIKRLSILPKQQANYVSEIMPQIEPAIQAIKDKYTALKPYIVTHSSVVELVNAIQTVGSDTNANNYQDYQLYEYWKYESAKNNAHNIVAQYIAPVAPDKYIPGSGLSETEITAIANAETNEVVKNAIINSMAEPSAEETKSFEQAFASFKYPSYTELQIQDAAKRLVYYNDFMQLNTRTGNKQFLDKEIKAAEAAKYVEANYTAKTWANYTKALADANAVNTKTGALGSEIFDAKYGLMIAQRNLMLKSNSCAEQGAYVELDAYIQQAQEMIKNKSLFTFTGTGITEAQAWANVIAALGYVANYDADKDGKAEQIQLYSSSAMAIRDADLFDTPTNMLKIDAAVVKLQEALGNFKASNSVVVNPTPPTGTVVPVIDEVEKIITGINPGTVDPTKVVENLKLTTSSGVTPEITVSKSRVDSYGTGSVVKVVVNGSTTAVYTIVVYGDVNGDGAIDGFDTFDFDRAMYNTPLSGAYAKAGDTNGDGVVNNDDYGNIKSASVGAFTITQK